MDRPNSLAARPRQLECVEIYVPKKLELLSELYTYLRSKLAAASEARSQGVTIDGFSLYEVDGAFSGERVYQERTLIVRLLFARQPDDDAVRIEAKIQELGREVAELVAMGEEELWICHYPQDVVIFRSTT